MMTKTRLFKFASILLFLVAILYFLENIFYLSWTIWWYDMLLHFLAGGLVGTTTLLFLQKFFNIETFSTFRVILSVVITAFVVGVLWEIFELFFGLTLLSDGIAYTTDTSSDLILDLVGALLGGLYGLKILKENE